MTEPHDDLRRRVERLENIQAELQALMRESTLMIARLNETLMELKGELVKLRDTEKDVARMKVSLSVVQWLGGTIASSGVVMALAYVFKVQS